MSNDPDYIKKQLARLKPISDENPHYTLQLRGFDGSHTNWMNFDAEQLEGIGRVLSGVKVSGTILNDIIKSAALYYSSGYSQYEYGYASRKKGERR